MLLLPYGDEPNDPKRVAWMNYTLIAVNVVVFLASWGLTGHRFSAIAEKWAFNPENPQLATVFSSMFLHAGWLHLFGNMLFLWIFGDNVEARLGPLGYLLAYLGLGMAATLIYGAFAEMPAVGASGAISGVQGLYFIACGRHKVKLFFWLFFFIYAFKINARLVMGFWFVMQDVIPTVLEIREHVGGQVAHMAHIGGFVSGLALMLVLRPLVARIEMANREEFFNAFRYRGGRASSPHYERRRKRNPYESAVRRRSKPLHETPDPHEFDEYDVD